MVILIKYGPENAAEKLKILAADKGDTVVLIQDGIFWAIEEKTDIRIPENVKVVAIKDDYLARGYKEENAPIPLINYDQFIEIVEKDTKIIS